MAELDCLEDIEARAINYFDPEIIGSGECRDIIRDLFPVINGRAGGNLDAYRSDLDQACFLIRQLQEIFLLIYWQSDLVGLRYSMYAWPNEATVRTRGYIGTNRAAFDRLIDALPNYLRHPWLQHDAIDASAICAILFIELSEVAPSNVTSAFIRWVTWTLRKSRTDAMSRAWQASLGRVINASDLKERVLVAERLGATYPPILQSLIDRAVVRDPNAMIRTRSIADTYGFQLR